MDLTGFSCGLASSPVLQGGAFLVCPERMFPHPQEAQYSRPEQPSKPGPDPNLPQIFLGFAQIGAETVGTAGKARNGWVEENAGDWREPHWPCQK